MKIAVIGAGYFGCHIACSLIERGHRVTVFDRQGIFASASGNNQERVHQGFHYPRSGKTRKEIREAHDRFVARYQTQVVDKNIYCVAKNSLIDFPTYLAICRAENLDFLEVDPADYGIESVEGAILTRERVIDTDATRARFREYLVGRLREADVTELRDCGDSVRVNGEQFDCAVNCSNLRIPDPHIDVFYEAAMILTVRGPEDSPSVTVMDGNLPALLATTRPGIFTLSQVGLTALTRCPTYEEAQEVLDRTPWLEKADLFFDAMKEYFPAIDEFEIHGVRKAVRTKPYSAADSRECLTHASDRVMTIACGKFMSVFIAEERVMSWLQHFSGRQASSDRA